LKQTGVLTQFVVSGPIETVGVGLTVTVTEVRVLVQVVTVFVTSTW
jgi:hypothetical protein